MYVVVGYVPHAGRHERPFADDFWREMRQFWATLPARAAKILMLDANGRMARGRTAIGADADGVAPTVGPADGVTGKWSLCAESPFG